MRRLILVLLLVLTAMPAVADDKIVEVVSPGGIRAWLRQDNSIPLMALKFRFSGGGRIVPAEKAGAAVLAARMLSEGAGEWDAETFRQALADNAIGLSFSAGRDSFSGDMTTLTENRKLAVSMLRAALTAPLLSVNALRQQKARLVSERRRSLTQPNSIAYRNWFRLAYDGHPYSRSTRGTPETVATVTDGDVRDFLSQVLTRQGLTIGVAGDITPDELAVLLDDAFGALPDHAPPPSPPPAPAPPPGLSVIEHPGQQSVIVFGHAGVARQDPDWYAALVVTQILGGSTFTSRLGKEVREKRGLAYGIGAGLSPSEAGAVLLGRTATRNEAAGEALALIESEWRRLAEDGPTPEEVDVAKTYLIGSFPLSLDSTGDIAGVLVQMQVYRLPRGYWDARPALFEAVTPERARQVAARLLQPDALLSVVVGNPDGIALSR